ncbi:MAG: hypothetical protein WBP84_06755, partial [Nitrososphaeraceae archaeon]
MTLDNDVLSSTKYSLKYYLSVMVKRKQAPKMRQKATIIETQHNLVAMRSNFRSLGPMPKPFSDYDTHV